MPFMVEDKEQQAPDPKQAVRKRKRRYCTVALCTILLLLLLLFITILILALTVFKPRQPRIQILSATVQGVAPRISLPIQLNITISLQLLVENRNRVSFKHGPGKTLLLYRDKEVGEADLPPGTMPARGSTTLPSRLTLQVDKFASDVGTVLKDILAGKIALETRTRIPGNIAFLGIFKKHVVSTLDCQITVGFPSMEVQNQECKSSIKF